MRDRSHATAKVLLISGVLLLPAACSKERPTKSAAPQTDSGAQAARAPSTPAASTPAAQTSDQQKSPSVVALSAGAYIVKRPSEWMESESAYALLDENPASVWATDRGVVSPQVIVIALPEKTLLDTIEFDNARTDAQFAGCSAKDIAVEVSDTTEKDGFQKVAEVTLQDRVNNQRFPVSAAVPGRWVRLTVKNNHTTDTDSTIELDEFRAYGKQLTHTAAPDFSGTYDFHFTGGLHLRQEGASLTGCYEDRRGLIRGGVEGHIAKLTWFEQNGNDESKEMGSGILLLTADAQQAIGVWWNAGGQANTEMLLTGPRTSTTVGSCPHWLGGVEQQMAADLENLGRARVYGINFDVDSDRIRDESKPTLDKIATILKAKPEWKVTVEGHTDSTSSAAHNQDLSERRASSVKKYLEAAGIDGSRLATVGFGATKAIASNDNELGRAQNRRVELVKQ